MPTNGKTTQLLSYEPNLKKIFKTCFKKDVQKTNELAYVAITKNLENRNRTHTNTSHI